MNDRAQQLREADPNGLRSNSHIERQVEGEEIVADIELATDFEELKQATLRLANWML